MSLRTLALLAAAGSTVGGGGGGGSALDTQTVTTGALGTAPNQDRIRGYSTGVLGSISDGTSNIFGGNSVTDFYWDENGGTPIYVLKINTATDSGWAQVDIGGMLTLTRASRASFVSNTWTWNAPGTTVPTQAFGSSGSSRVCVFT